MTRISRIATKNFRSFRDIEVELGPLEVIIGPNAAGKSNLVEVVRFLSDIAKTGFENAVSLHGGAEFIPNATTPEDEVELSITVEHDPPNPTWPLMGFDSVARQAWVGTVHREALTITLACRPREEYATVVSSSLRVDGEMDIGLRQGGQAGHRSSLGEFAVEITPKQNRLLKWPGPRGEDSQRFLDRASMISSFVQSGQSHTPVEGPVGDLLPIGRFLRDVRFYEFDPRTIERAVPISGPADLQPDASNLPIVLKRLLRDEQSRGKLLRLLRRLLPFLQEVDVVRQADQSLLIEFVEGFSPGTPLPAFLMSGGTRNLTAMIVALYFEDSSLTIIEEPEANVHPTLISRICEMFVEASANRQVMVTTHDPEILRYVPMESVLVVSRDTDGFSRAERLGDRPGVVEFLEQELGVSDLQLMGLLGGAR